ncbi:uncharacterized protein F5891DRAFT_771510 [Suillus fuscotomentosus]|uniref:Uncharacterized protein n=1 Tax=Suillus fuscotomentosus TaxID=1912939 RepID=A0AAD4DT66_9AGAM|nr:uncharacterized protein F5891DRAFT_771510 [Suillus fuscotomentosus]KAG1893500.1 hypothetical protein F5891DRAFT_771510 [Suillus fuscotomentosus]
MTASTKGAILTVTTALVWCAKVSASNSNLTVSPGAYANPLMYNVGPNYTVWRTLSTVGFNPTNTAPTFIQVFDPLFLHVTRSSQTSTQASLQATDALGYNGWYKNSISA